MKFMKSRALGGGALAALLMAAACASAPGDAPQTASTAAPVARAAPVATSQQTAPITEGQKIVMATHSFNVFVGPSRRGEPSPGPLAALAAESGKAGHETLAVQMIGGSTPMQHWNQGDGDDSKNIAKAALKAAGDDLDVFTMSPNAIMPEDGIDLFGDYVIEHNPNARIMVQASWSAYDGQGSTPSVGGSGGGSFSNDQRDGIDMKTLDSWIEGVSAYAGGRPDYMPRMRAQLEGIDERAGREITHVVPSSIAVYNLRKQVLAGNVPGVKVQSELFLDPIGHPTTPTANLVTYVWYAAMYRESPVGLTALIDAADPTSAGREELLQRIAWNAVVGEPKSGVAGEPVAVPSTMVQTAALQ